MNHDHRDAVPLDQPNAVPLDQPNAGQVRRLPATSVHARGAAEQDATPNPSDDTKRVGMTPAVITQKTVGEENGCLRRLDKKRVTASSVVSRRGSAT